YLELRFGRLTRIYSSLIYMVWMLLYMAINLYGPALALNIVTGLPLQGSIIAVGVVCTFYTTLGGMKAVLWTDTLQVCVMLAGIIALLVRTSAKVGGFLAAWDIAEQNHRIEFFELSGDPRERMSLWATIFGGGVYWCCVYGTNQAQIQRALSLPSLTKAKLSIWLNVLGFGIIVSLFCMVGIVMFAFYSTCDKIKSRSVSKPDQLMVLLTSDVLGETQGLSGIILAIVFSGSLSVMSSGLNAMAAVLLEDYIKPFCCIDVKGLKAKVVSMTIVVIGGIVCLGLAFIVSEFGAILQAAYSLLGILGGPLLGVFVLGMIFPWANQWGAIIGESVSLGILIWIGLGTQFAGIENAPSSHVHTSGCNFLPGINNVSGANASFEVYKISHMWYSAIAVVLTVTFGLVVSLATGYTKPSDVDPRLICPLFDVLFPCLPEFIKRPLLFGVKHKLTPSTVKRKSPPKVKKNKKGHDNYQMDTANDDIARLVMGIPLNGVSPFSTMVQDLPVEGKKEEIEMQKYGELDFQGLDSEMDFGLVSENGLLQLNLSSFF
ncbi:hypothetical protein ScPMuIL_004044, partial [Solemya velum]